ncbi:MAG: mandelate racemase/muconate lactonizing enzyme family protein [Thermoplasmata archaeon]|nr:mandelate racemase/muconate lactonizing enzyme family protein [Thermoplasmata archaeon]MCI4355745.1 mandelate racemase/muconate lactonizing enzyme family protein [Thermoplasmata archaeon]
MGKQIIREVEPIEVAAPAGEASSPWSSTVVLVKVTTTSGAVGWGEAPTTLMTRPVFESVAEVARFYRGRSLAEHRAAFAEYERYSFYRSRSMEATSALSAVDIACHDLVGHELGCPVSDLLGGRLRNHVRAYSNGWYSDCRDPAEFAAKAKAMTDSGFGALKFDPFGDQFGQLSPAGLRLASARVGAVREAVGEDVDLLIEYHGRFFPEAAIRAGRELEQYHPRFAEEPVRPELCDALVDFRRRVSTPVALGERLLTPSDFLSFLSRGLVDILQPDITNSGGFTSGREISGVAAAFGAPVAYHNAFGPIQTAATLQIDATLPTFFVQESFEASWPEWKRSLVRGYTIENGGFRIPTGPGLGVEVDERAVERFRSDVMEPISPEPPWVIAGTWVDRGGTSPSKATSKGPGGRASSSPRHRRR